MLSDVRVTLLSGRNDFCISFKGGGSKESDKYKKIIKWLSDTLHTDASGKNDAMRMLSHFETSIESVLRY